MFHLYKLFAAFLFKFYLKSHYCAAIGSGSIKEMCSVILATLTLLWKRWRWTQAFQFDLLYKPEDTVTNMVIMVPWVDCLPCGRPPGYSQHLPSSGFLHPTLRTKTWYNNSNNAQIFLRQQGIPSLQKRDDEFVQEHPSCLRLHWGTSWQKAFWINLLIHCPVKRVWESAQWDQQLLLSTNVVSLEFNKVICIHSIRLYTHTSLLFKDFQGSFSWCIWWDKSWEWHLQGSYVESVLFGI